jgi:hypothetical protein
VPSLRGTLLCAFLILVCSCVCTRFNAVGAISAWIGNDDVAAFNIGYKVRARACGCVWTWALGRRMNGPLLRTVLY